MTPQGVEPYRRAIAIHGIVQGVGFRPYVYGLATRLHLRGFIKNVSGGVLIEVEGEPHSLDRFLVELTDQPPPLARIDALRWSSRPALGDPSFRIETSDGGDDSPIFISPDVATCDECLTELVDPRDRRYRYPFLNCTSCGPRLTIIMGSPYDRERTTMAPFAMCPECRAEYDDPADRRFHAQPTACPACGPRLRLLDSSGEVVPGIDPLAGAVDALRRGLIGAIKGLGGYHLACIAGDATAVVRLRSRKHRDEKPFALMVRDLAAARALAEVSPNEEDLLVSPRRPIVLLRRKPGVAVALDVAPHNPWLGVMLPYTPLHHLLLRELGDIPLVMTSGNRSDEPIAYQDRDALEQLSGIADFFLTHDRPIHLRCDDSVTRVVSGVELPIRRSRGDAPRPIRLPIACERPTLALGGQLKATFALGRGRNAIVSHHVGDLDHCEAFRAYGEAIAHYERLFGASPALVVHDLHPDYASTRYAEQHARARPTLAVQHHHAHVASCMAENGLDEPVIGVAFDGTGYGTDGTIWGGEFLVGDYVGFRRAAHLRPVVLPGGEQAIREPWRMAAAYLLDAGLDLAPLAGTVPATAVAAVERIIARRFNSPPTTSAGRLFDAVAALAGVRRRVSYEGQAAIELEWLATGVEPDGIYPFEVQAGTSGSTLVLDTRPMIAEIAEDLRRGVSLSAIARRFHSTLVEAIARLCGSLRAETGLDAVALSGGVFLNALLSAEAAARLEGDGFRVYRHRRVPPNDGGLCLGQLAVAAARGRTPQVGRAGQPDRPAPSGCPARPTDRPQQTGGDDVSCGAG
jgi:hydrogenase maturation protein HypF